jgi:hypothetical protein
MFRTIVLRVMVVHHPTRILAVVVNRNGATQRGAPTPVAVVIKGKAVTMEEVVIDKEAVIKEEATKNDEMVTPAGEVTRMNLNSIQLYQLSQFLKTSLRNESPLKKRRTNSERRS